MNCQHDKGKLVEESTNAGIIYRCNKCNCVYRIMLVTNDTKCYNKRFPVKNMVSLAETNVNRGKRNEY